MWPKLGLGPSVPNRSTETEFWPKERGVAFNYLARQKQPQQTNGHKDCALFGERIEGGLIVWGGTQIRIQVDASLHSSLKLVFPGQVLPVLEITL